MTKKDIIQLALSLMSLREGGTTTKQSFNKLAGSKE